MRIDIDTVPLITILKSKTLTKILAKILEAELDTELENNEVVGLRFSMEDLRKTLRYRNKSTVSRGLKALSELGVFDINTTNQGTVLGFNPERIRRI